MRKTCTVCEARFWRFRSYGIPKKRGRCPVCGAKSRTRAVAHFLQSEMVPHLIEGARVLEIGANNVSLSRFLSPRFLGLATHTTLDVVRMPVHRKIQPPHEFVLGDATQMPFAAATFDLVLCNHVLAFIPEKDRVLAEIRRVLKPTGVAMLNAALSPGHTRGVDEVRAGNPKLEQDFFVENGTAWFFGQDDYRAWLEKAGFVIEEQAPFAERSEAELKRRGLKRDEVLFLTRLPA